MRYNRMFRFHEYGLVYQLVVRNKCENIQGQSMRKMRVLWCFDRKMSLHCYALQRQENVLYAGVCLAKPVNSIQYCCCFGSKML